MTYECVRHRWYRTVVNPLIEEDLEWESRRPEVCG